MSNPKTTDVSKIHLTVPMAVAMTVSVMALVGGMWGIVDRKSSDYEKKMTEIASDVRNIKTGLEYEAKLRDRDAELLNQRFAALEAKIEAAGLRNAAMALSQELAKQKVK